MYGLDKGKLEVIASTETYFGPDFEDPAQSTYIFNCSSCPALYVVNGGWKLDSIEPDQIKLYQGLLTKEEIEMYLPAVRGLLNSRVENDILAASRPTEYSKKPDVFEKTKEGALVQNGFITRSFVKNEG